MSPGDDHAAAIVVAARPGAVLLSQSPLHPVRFIEVDKSRHNRRVRFALG